MNRDRIRPQCPGRRSASRLVAGAGLTVLNALAAAAETPILANLTFEQLSQIQITTASKRSQSVMDVAAAVSVVTREEIGRSGATVIPEALRFVPGLQAGQINAHDWAVSARGSNSRFANKQLVLVDGRTIYSPFSGGVYWEAAGPPLEEIEQIEVIRGPGGTAWGANAVNGVINIVTLSARETPGGWLSTGGGTERNVLSYGRYGFQLGPNTWARIYGAYDRTDQAGLAHDHGAGDAWQDGRGGIRLDGDLSESSHLMFQTEFSETHLDEPGSYPMLTPPYQAEIPEANDQFNAHVLGRWTREFSTDAKLTVQSFWSHEQRDQFRNDFRNETFDLDLTHQFQLGARQTVVWGGGARYVAHDLSGKVGVVFPDPHPSDEVFNGFVQDEIQVVPDRLGLTLGTKIERYNVTGQEWEPSVRIAWKPTEQQTLWAAVSRSVHAPSVLERDIRFDAAVVSPPLTILRQITQGTDRTTAQVAYELGYRFQPVTHLSLEVALFYNDLPDAQVFQRGAAFPEAVPAPAHYVVPVRFDPAGADGRAYGVELAATWQVAEQWRLFAEYSFFEDHFDLLPSQSTFATRSPRHWLGLRSALDLPQHWELDLGLRYVAGVPGTSIGSYLTGEVRLAWRPTERWEFSLVGQNLLQDQHAEMMATASSSIGAAVEIQRSVYARVTWRF